MGWPAEALDPLHAGVGGPYSYALAVPLIPPPLAFVVSLALRSTGR